MKKIALAAICAFYLLSAPICAASPSLIGDYGDWSAYYTQEGKNTVCYMASSAQKSEGKYTSRGDVYMVITHRPADKSFDVVNFVAGYTYKANAPITVKIGSNKITDLFADKDKAWSISDTTDKKLVAEMKKGNQLIIEGSSFKGTQTKDTYSLKGFSAAYRAISEKCRR